MKFKRDNKAPILRWSDGSDASKELLNFEENTEGRITMIKIKQKVEMNLVQILEYVWKNDMKDKWFVCKEDNVTKHIISVSPSGRINLDSGSYYEKTDVFTVEIEEEITEDTKIYNLRHLTPFGFTGITETRSINDVKTDYSQAFYIMNDDKTMRLIWTKEKGLVE